MLFYFLYDRLNCVRHFQGVNKALCISGADISRYYLIMINDYIRIYSAFIIRIIGYYVGITLGNLFGIFSKIKSLLLLYLIIKFGLNALRLCFAKAKIKYVKAKLFFVKTYHSFLSRREFGTNSLSDQQLKKHF